MMCGSHPADLREPVPRRGEPDLHPYVQVRPPARALKNEEVNDLKNDMDEMPDWVAAVGIAATVLAYGLWMWWRLAEALDRALNAPEALR